MKNLSLSERKSVAKTSVSNTLKSLGQKLVAATVTMDVVTTTINVETEKVSTEISYKANVAKYGSMELTLEQTQQAAIRELMMRTKPSKTLVGACLRWLRAKIARATVVPVTKVKIWVTNSPSKIVQTVAKVVTKVANFAWGVFCIASNLFWLGVGMVSGLLYIAWAGIRSLWSYLFPAKVVEAESVSRPAYKQEDIFVGIPV